MDIGKYSITKDGEEYEVFEELSGKRFRFTDLAKVMAWIQADVEEVEAS
jgi:hypothetical protein